MKRPAFSRLLIANRGEIAIRIARAAADLGLQTVAIFAEDDARSLHLRRADRAVALRGSGVAAYLDVDQVIDAALAAGCEAVHPGYGFLAESARFAERCAEAGLVFVGPSPASLALFGDKTAARRHAVAMDVPVLDGTHGATSLTEARRFFESLGPRGAVMVKALAGGGGRGMRAVERLEDLDDAFERCRSEARASFGVDAVYLECLIARARHIEIQVVGDGSGTVIALGERECTLQRRHQKLIEVSPSPSLGAALRQRLIADALRMAAATRYAGLGTFEFLVNADDASEVAFIEANARLQVEHTVTEAVTGVDLVRVQLQLAAGASLDALGLAGPPIAPRGRAIQLRVNMERITPLGQALPAGGTLAVFEMPGGPGVRVDTFGYAGYATTPNYDSLLAKLIVHLPPSGAVEHAVDGHQALLDKALRALGECRIEGVSNNVDFLRALLRHPDVRADRIDTRFVEAHGAALAADAQREPLAPYAGAVPPQGGVDASGAASEAAAPDGSLDVAAPLQGRVVRLQLREGDPVRAGQTLLVIEAMKMEHQVGAPCDGRITALRVAVGDGVLEGSVLLRLSIESAAGAPDGAAPADERDADSARLLDAVLQRQAGLLDAARPPAVAKARQRGAMTARERIAALCEPGSFCEVGGLVRPLDVDREAPADGVVTGTGRIDGRAVVLVSQDFSVFGGSVGHLGGRKKENAARVALRHGLPLIMLLDGGGHRIQDGQNSRDYADAGAVFQTMTQLSGWVPVVACVLGAGFAANTNSAGMADFVVMVRGRATMGLAGPALVKAGTGESVGVEALGGAEMQVDRTGLADLGVANEADALAAVRRFLSFLPSNAREVLPVSACAPTVPYEERVEPLLGIVPANTRRVYDVRQVIALIADEGSLFEIKPTFAANLVTAFGRLDGRPVGFVANQPLVRGGMIDAPACDKGAHFIAMCDAFGLPLVHLIDVPGMAIGSAAERSLLGRRSAKLLHELGHATVPRLSIVLRKGYGLAYYAMSGGRSFDADACFAWPSAEICAMSIEGSVDVAFRKEVESAPDPAARRQALIDAIRARVGPLQAAEGFGLDDVIDPRTTRARLLEVLARAPARRASVMPPKHRPIAPI